jgi:RHS repeat-associated protein
MSSSITDCIDEPVVSQGAGTGTTIYYFHRNHQYSVTAISTSAGTIAERYAYTAYGQPTILDASGAVLQTSDFSLRYSFTGREWDATLGLHHFRARWMNPSAGRFLGRDPIGYEGSEWGLYEFLESNSFGNLDPFGKSCLCGEEITCVAKCGPIACLMARVYRDLAMRRAMREAQGDWEGHNDKIDAYRHCLWSCYIASSGVGEESAFCVTQVHEECDKDQPVEEYCMDFWNNAKGREASRGVPVVSCDTACWNMLQNGELQTVDRCPSKSDKDRRRRSIVNATRE